MLSPRAPRNPLLIRVVRRTAVPRPPTSDMAESRSTLPVTITVIVTGGVLRLSAMSLFGDLGTAVLRTTRINKGFLGARGLSIERGLMDLNPDEVRIKQEMADACEQVYGILDGTKWHRSALLAFVPVEELTGIVTDSTAPTREVEAWRAAGVDVVVAGPGPQEPLLRRPRDLRLAMRNEEAG